MQRSVASFGLRMWRRCAFAFALSYKKVTRGSELLPGYAMPAPGLVDLKRRRRVASRVLLSDARGGDTAKKNIAFDIIIIASRTLLKIGRAASV